MSRQERVRRRTQVRLGYFRDSAGALQGYDLLRMAALEQDFERVLFPLLADLCRMILPEPAVPCCTKGALCSDGSTLLRVVLKAASDS